MMYFIFLDIRPSYHIRLDTNSVWPVNAYNKDKKNPFTTLLITYFLSSHTRIVVRDTL